MIASTRRRKFRDVYWSPSLREEGGGTAGGGDARAAPGTDRTDRRGAAGLKGAAAAAQRATTGGLAGAHRARCGGGAHQCPDRA